MGSNVYSYAIFRIQTCISNDNLKIIITITIIKVHLDRHNKYHGKENKDHYSK